MIRTLWMLLVAALLPLAGRAGEPYRPLPRLPADEVERRAKTPPPPPAPAPVPVPGQAPAPASPTAQQPEPSAKAEALAAPAPTPGARGAPTLDTFRAALAPFGTWERWPEHGWVWRPEVPPDWRPYFDGHWIWTARGWSWSSDEPWGWATYHYGRWAYDPAAGWAWVPGLDWAPAWVRWRWDAEVVGWAPQLAGADAGAPERSSARQWVFVPRARFRPGLPVPGVAYPAQESEALWARFAGVGDPVVTGRPAP